MYRVVLTTKVKRKIKKFSGQGLAKVIEVIDLLQVNPFGPKLKTHKLSGSMSNLYSCSLDYSNRIIFFIFRRQGNRSSGYRVSR